MGCKTETLTIDEHEYSVTQWPAEKGLLMKFKLIKFFGASLAKIVSIVKDVDGKDKKQKIDTNEVAKGIGESLSELFDHNSPEDLVKFMKECIVGVAYDGKRITENSFNEVFDTDSMSTIYRVFFFIIKVNYSNLMKGQLADNLLAKIKDIQ